MRPHCLLMLYSWDGGAVCVSLGDIARSGAGTMDASKAVPFQVSRMSSLSLLDRIFIWQHFKDRLFTFKMCHSPGTRVKNP